MEKHFCETCNVYLDDDEVVVLADGRVFCGCCGREIVINMPQAELFMRNSQK